MADERSKVQEVGQAIDAAAEEWLRANGDQFGMADVPLDVLARAAIAAMRHPSLKMVNAADDNVGVGPKTAGFVYTAMINAALAEE